MANRAHSPAVQLQMNEPAQQANNLNREELDKVLQSTLSACAPVSVSHASVPSGRIDTDAAVKVTRDDIDAVPEVSAPLVDLALEATGEGRHARGDNSAYRREAERITETVSDFAAGTKQIAELKVMGGYRQIEDYARAKPFKVAAMVGSIAFLFGLTR